MNELIGTLITKSQAEWISTSFYISYAAGQMLNGMLIEKKNPYAVGIVGIIGGGLMNLLFPMAHSFEVLLALRFIAGYCMSMLWPSIMQMMVGNMEHDDLVQALVRIASSMALGTLSSYLLSAALTKFFSWKSAFIVPGAMILLSAAFWMTLRPMADQGGQRQSEGLTDEVPKTGNTPLPLVQLILIPAFIWSILPTICHGVIKDGVTSWVPTYICEEFGKTTSFAAFVSMVIPIVNLSGAYMAKFVYRKLDENVFLSAAMFFALATLLLLGMLGFAGNNIVITLILFAMTASAMMAVNVLFINLFLLQFEKHGRSASVSGMLNAIAYGGSAAASGLIGVLSSAKGWSATVGSWCIVMGIAFAVCMCAMLGRQIQAKRQA